MRQRIRKWPHGILLRLYRHHRSFERNLALLNYNDTASRSMSPSKYKNKREYLDFYSEALWLRFGRQIHFWNPDLFVPVPIHPTRRKIRGFNQAEVLAEKLSEKSGIPVCGGALKRIRKTAPQKTLDSSARFHNLEQAFGPGSIPKGYKKGAAGGWYLYYRQYDGGVYPDSFKDGSRTGLWPTVCIGKN